MAAILLVPAGMAHLRSLSTLAAVASLVSVACSEDDRPGDRVLAKTTQLVQYQTCSALETDLEDMLIHEISASIDRYSSNDFGAGGAEDGAPTSDDSGGREEGVDFSGTNNQEDGVDEADFVKTDGYHVYALNGNQLHIFGVPEFGMLVPTSATPVEGHARQMLIDKDANRVVVFSYIDVGQLPEQHPLRAAVGYQEDEKDWYWRSRMISKITVFDMTDRANLELLREVYFEGQYQTARKVDTSIRVASYAMIDRPELWNWYELLQTYGKAQTKVIVSSQIRALSLADLIPQMYVRTPDGQFKSNSLHNSSCRSFYRPTDSHARGISSIISFDLLGPATSSVAWDADHVVSNHAVFYASTDRIVLAESAHNWWWYWWYPQDPDQLNVHAFDISRPGKSQYVGSGRVEGMLSDQFAIDEQDGAFRLATTTNLWWRWWNDDEQPEPENHVWVLEQDGPSLSTVGHIGGIAKGERIMSARFLDDKGYLVTFRQVDPLFTIDLSDNTNPRLVGELKIPGFSTYIHPLGDSNLLTIGVGGDENGANWRTTISLFDVGDFANPALDVSLPIAGEDGWGWSEALWEHKAFQFWAPKKLLAVPQATYAYDSTGSGYTYRYISRLELIEVDPTLGAGGLRHYGAIDHSPYYQAEADRYWQYVDIRRSIFMGDYIYAISDKAISVHRTSDLGKVTDALLPGYQPGDYYWWW